MDKQYQNIINHTSFAQKDVPSSIYMKILDTIEKKEQERLYFDPFLSLFKPRKLAVAFALLLIGIFSSNQLVLKLMPKPSELYLSQFYLSDTPEYMIRYTNQL